MFAGQFVFSQIMTLVPKHEFNKCVRRYQSNYKPQKFSCLDQFFCMAFAQLTYRESLRDIQACLKAMQSKLYHMGIRGHIAKSTLADANENRDSRIYADFAQVLISKAKRLYANEDFGVELDTSVYALDSTTIDLCLSVFPWARFRKTKGAVKLHTLLNLRGSIPEFIHISDGKMHDVNVLDILLPEAGAFYLMDRGYTDFERLYSMNQARSFFVTRSKKNFRFKRRYSYPIDETSGLQCDQTIILTGFYPAKYYPEPLRRIRYYDTEINKRFIFLTNNLDLSALTIAQLYKARRQVELFFKWIKQHLRIKAFYGTSENAVKTQIWIAVSIYVLVAILKKEYRIDQGLYTILQILSVTLFEKSPIFEVFAPSNYTNKIASGKIQLNLFDF
jgi:hypothetical protein